MVKDDLQKRYDALYAECLKRGRFEFGDMDRLLELTILIEECGKDNAEIYRGNGK